MEFLKFWILKIYSRITCPKIWKFFQGPPNQKLWNIKDFFKYLRKYTGFFRDIFIKMFNAIFQGKKRLKKINKKKKVLRTSWTIVLNNFRLDNVNKFVYKNPKSKNWEIQKNIFCNGLIIRNSEILIFFLRRPWPEILYLKCLFKNHLNKYSETLKKILLVLTFPDFLWIFKSKFLSGLSGF